MATEFYLVHKSILPEYLETVIKIREEIEETGIDISNACKKYNISRSTYYKYKDNVFKPVNEYSNRAVISLHAKDRKGVLSNLLNLIASYGANIISLNLGIPVHESAYTTIALDVSEMTIEIKELLAKMREIEWIRAVELIAFEG